MIKIPNLKSLTTEQNFTSWKTNLFAFLTLLYECPKNWMPKIRMVDLTVFLNTTGHPLFQGVSHDLSNISYSPPSCSSLVSHPFVAWPILINVSVVR